MFESLYDYIGYKSVEAFVLNPSEGLDEQIDIPFLDCVLRYIEINAENFSYDLKQEILKKLSDLRFINDEDRIERIEIINEIIRTLNVAEEDEEHCFYIFQLYNRFNDEIFLKSEVTNNNVELVNLLILLDYIILGSHTDLMPDDEFYDKYINEFVFNPFYYSNISIIIEEYPDILKDITFVKRFKLIHKINKQHNFIFGENEQIHMEKILKKIETK